MMDAPTSGLMHRSEISEVSQEAAEGPDCVAWLRKTEVQVVDEHSTSRRLSSIRLSSMVAGRGPDLNHQWEDARCPGFANRRAALNLEDYPRSVLLIYEFMKRSVCVSAEFLLFM